MKLGAIDIGSNAARLLICEATETKKNIPDFIKLALVRVPLRLGFDVFEKGIIPQAKIDKFIKTLESYKLLMDVYDVTYYRACATSAMRDASNAAEIIEQTFNRTGIRINVISGQEEAAMINENHVADGMDKSKSYLYIDVGGGSTELTFFSDGKLVFKESFNIGTIRLLKSQVDESGWQKMKDFIKQNTKAHHDVIAIGTGGNINKVFSMSKRKIGKPLQISLLRDYYKEFNSISIPQRMSLYKMKEDRADVIVPALLIYINVMRWANAEDIYVPQIGLADGLIQSLYYEIKNKNLR